MDELWRQCVSWLVDTRVLPPQHKTTYPSAQIFDLAQTLRDGVVLCNLLNAIKPGAVDLTRINIRPQMLQFLCVQNIHTVLHSLQNVFGIASYELFEARALYEMSNFRQVLRVLSILSYLPVSSKKFRPFPSDIQGPGYHREDEEDIYAPLEDLASERELIDEEEDLYDSVPEAEDGIYGSVIDIKQPSGPQPKDKRAFCVNEIVETERNYVNHLDMMQKKFIMPLRNMIDESDIKILFGNTEQLLPVHQNLLNGINNALNSNPQKLSKPFLDVKNGLLQYGTYCSNLPEALTHLANLVENETFKMHVDQLQNQATPNKFKLRELLCVSMQRILKYHLLIKELHRQTSDGHLDKQDLSKTLEEMQEVALYINEVKRDSEMLQTINKVEACLTDYQTNSPLSTYGRLLKDGDLKIKSSKDKKAQVRFTYLFDQALFMTVSSKNENYKLTDLVRLEDFVLDETYQPKGNKWSWSWTLRDKYQAQSYTMYAKTQGDKQKWVEQLKLAFENIHPSVLKGKDNAFRMTTFSEPTYCSQCHKLLLGCFYQGYACERTKKVCHKECLLDAWKSVENDCAPPLAARRISTTPSSALPAVPSNQLGQTFIANRDYNGIPAPPPPFPKSTIKFTVGLTVEVVEQSNANWWLGRVVDKSYDRIGYFPASYVDPTSSRSKSRPKKPSDTSYVPTVPGSFSMPPPPIPASPSTFRPPSNSTADRLEEFDWFAGTQDRVGAEQLLRGKPSGSYLIRTRDGHYAITLVFRNEMKHIRIFETPQNQYYVAECKNFSTVPELVKFYQNNMLSSSFFGLETELKQPYRSRQPTVQRPNPSRPPPLAYPNVPVSPSRSLANQIEINGRLVEVMSLGRVMYDFDPQSPQELGLRVGQTVNIISKPDGENGWWKGEYQSRVGYFPAKFVREMR